MVRFRAAAAAFVVAVVALVGFFTPGPASAVPLPLTAPCVGSSVCSPAAPGIIAELAAQGGGVTTAGTSLTAAEAASFQGIVAGYGATATASGSSIVGAASAVGASGSSLPFVGAAVGLLTGGVAAWGLQLDGDTTGLPAGSTGAVGIGDLSFSLAGFTYTISVNLNAAQTGPNYYSVISGSATPYQGDPGTQLFFQLKCNGAWDATNYASLNGWQFTYANPTLTQNAPVSTGCRTGSIQEIRVLTGSNFSTATVRTTATINWSSGAPQRWVEQTVTCKNRAGTEVSVTNSSAAGAWTGSEAVQLLALMCPSGYRAKSWSAKVKTQGGADTDLGTVPGTSYPSNPADADCGYVGDSLCILRLERRSSVSADTWVSCHTGSVACTKWAEDPARDQTYRCRYGPAAGPFVTVSLGACSIYVNAFPADPETNTPTIEQPAPLPGPSSPPADANCDLGWADVLSGAVVYKAVSCALAWAFVPSDTAFSSAQTKVSTAWTTSSVGQLLTAEFEALSSLATIGEGQGSSCAGLQYEFPLLGAGHDPIEVNLLDACEEPMSDLAPIVKTIGSVVIIVYGVFELVRLIGVGLGVQVGKPREWEQGTLF